MKIAAWVLAGVLLVSAGLYGAWRAGTTVGEKMHRQRAAQASSPSARAGTPADAAALLAPYEQALSQTTRPVMHVRLQALDTDDALVSKVGGQVWWPRAQALPVDEHGRPLTLLAQVNFAELPEPLPGYPDQGLLQFFIATEDDFYGARLDSMDSRRAQRNFRVVYWPDLGLPARTLPAVQGDQLPMDPSRPQRMHFVAGAERMSVADHRFDQHTGQDLDGLTEAYAAAHGIDADSLFQAVLDLHDGGGHKLGGYPSFTQEDPRRDGDDELLLQLDSDDVLMWGDSGVANFFIRPADLARRDFSRVAYNWDCY
ncbi:YwqG family protein [Pseudoxanthomonas composti]|nr:YwqG family protein [Pseudoxanthomonas composti]